MTPTERKTENETGDEARSGNAVENEEYTTKEHDLPGEEPFGKFLWNRKSLRNSLRRVLAPQLPPFTFFGEREPQAGIYPCTSYDVHGKEVEEVMKKYMKVFETESGDEDDYYDDDCISPRVPTKRERDEERGCQPGTSRDDHNGDNENNEEGAADDEELTRPPFLWMNRRPKTENSEQDQPSTSHDEVQPAPKLYKTFSGALVLEDAPPPIDYEISDEVRELMKHIYVY